jgi:RimJ/RimL family protein N-acetyltransferase
LRLFADGDLEEFMSLYNRYSQRGQFYPIAVRSLTQCRKEFGEKGWWDEDQGRMLVTDKQGRMIGTIFFFKGAPYQESYEIGYAILQEKDRGQGFMTEALQLFSAYMFEWKQVPRLQLVVHPDNVPSRRIAEKCGYRHEGTLRKSYFLRGAYHDSEMYSMLRDECPPTPEPGRE